MTCSAFRSVSGAYKSINSKNLQITSPLKFLRNIAIYTIGVRGRDARFTKDGLLSLWTVAGRKRYSYKVPKNLNKLFSLALCKNCLKISEDRFGKLKVDLTITILVPEPSQGKPVGIDLNATNAVVAANLEGEVFFETGLATRIRNKRTRKTIRRLQIKKAALKADGKSTRSVRRLLKRLGRKRSNRTKDFARCVAKKLVSWAGPNAVLVFENLKFDKRRKKSKAINRKLSEWPHAIIKQCVKNKAEMCGSTIVEVNPAYTSQTCSRCGNLGTRLKHDFNCLACGYHAHADVNAAINIRRKFTVAA
jgi:IS605 OrfB family transposase